MNLRWEILNLGILITPSRRHRYNEVYLPSFSTRIKIYYKNDKIWIKMNNHYYSINAEFEDGKITERIIDTIVALIRYHRCDFKIKF